MIERIHTVKEQFKTSIGGQAVIEGVMMRGPGRTALAVRQPDGEIFLEDWPNRPNPWYKKAPVIRGIFNMASSLVVGYKTLMRSAEIAGQEEEDPSKFEKWVAKKLGKNVMSVVAAFAGVVGIVLAILLFAVLPTAVAGLFSQWIGSGALRSLVEGVLKIGVFVGYIALVARVPDIRRVFEYHGAEHKTIACYEAGLPLTVENIRPQTRFHPRCGTSFLLIVLVISILVFSLVTLENTWLRVALKIVLIPVVVGLAYELIRLAGRYNNPVTRVISAPGLWMQRLTTSEPDDSQIEVAIASMGPVIPEQQGSDLW